MIEVAAALSAATTAFNAIKKGFEVGRDIESMAGDLGRWMGAASDGGYLGTDVVAFLSSLLSGAAGAYVCTLDEDAEIHTDVEIHAGMRVRISSDLAFHVLGAEGAHWGTGSFFVSELAALELHRVGAANSSRDGLYDTCSSAFLSHMLLINLGNRW